MVLLEEDEEIQEMGSIDPNSFTESKENSLMSSISKIASKQEQLPNSLCQLTPIIEILESWAIILLNEYDNDSFIQMKFCHIYLSETTWESYNFLKSR